MTTREPVPSRRLALKAASALALSQACPPTLGLPLAGLGALAARSAGMADPTDAYKALVCVFLHGGNDSHNWVVPMDPAGHAEYTAARGDLAFPLARLQPIPAAGQASGRAFGMPDPLAPLRKWYIAGQAGVIANVGPLVRPISRADFAAGVGLPAKLFSHNDQSSAWQSLQPEGTRSGWGGRMGDILAAANAYPAFTAVSANGNAVFLAGRTTTQYQVSQDGLVTVGALGGPSVFGSTNAVAALRKAVATPGSDPLQAAYAAVMQRGLDTSSLLGTALASGTVLAVPSTPISLGTGTTTLDQTSLARQLNMVARMIRAAQSMGLRRQVFMVGLSGFDTHANQMREQPALMAQVALSIDYFLSAVQGMGLLPNVTLFTASDFGRTLLSNGDGSDHGWGGHQFVAGGSVAGGTIHGRFPVTALGTQDDIGSGRLLPALSVSQMVVPMARWMGVSDTEIASVLPGIGNFDANALRFV